MSSGPLRNLLIRASDGPSLCHCPSLILCDPWFPRPLAGLRGFVYPFCSWLASGFLLRRSHAAAATENQRPHCVWVWTCPHITLTRSQLLMPNAPNDWWHKVQRAWDEDIDCWKRSQIKHQVDLWACDYCCLHLDWRVTEKYRRRHKWVITELVRDAIRHQPTKTTHSLRKCNWMYRVFVQIKYLLFAKTCHTDAFRKLCRGTWSVGNLFPYFISSLCQTFINLSFFAVGYEVHAYLPAQSCHSSSNYQGHCKQAFAWDLTSA